MWGVQNNLFGNKLYVFNCLSPSKKVWYISASSDNCARLWSVEGGTVQREYAGHQKAVTSLAFCDQVTVVESWSMGKGNTSKTQTIESFTVALSNVIQNILNSFSLSKTCKRLFRLAVCLVFSDLYIHHVFFLTSNNLYYCKSHLVIIT